MTAEEPDALIRRVAPQVVDALSAHPAALHAIAVWLHGKAHPCWKIVGERAGAGPLELSLLDRLIGRTAAEPQLGPMISKFGGRPYLESELDWPAGGRFLGQVAFDGLEPIGELPRHGILAVYVVDDADEHGFVVRWYPQASPERAVVGTGPSVGAWEATMRFERMAMYPFDDAWQDLPEVVAAFEGQPDLADYLADLLNEALGEQCDGDQVLWDDLARTDPEPDHALGDKIVLWHIGDEDAAEIALGSRSVNVVAVPGQWEHAEVWFAAF